MTSNNSQTPYAAIIIGSGMAGATLACALAAANDTMCIALVDAAPLANKTDHRLIALSYSSYCLFHRLNIWDALEKNAAPMHQVHVSHRGRFGITRLDREDMQLPALGYVVQASFINASLAEKLQAFPQIDIYRPATLKNLSGNTVTLETATGDLILHGTTIIGADGTHSTVRKLADINANINDYVQTAIVTITTLQRSHQNIAYERFHDTGAIAMLPLTGLRAATIWTDGNDVAEKLIQLSDDDFLQELQQQFGYRLGRLLQVETRYTYPVRMHTAAAVVKDNVVLIGNAAHTLHPIAAQGLNLTLAEIAMLTQTLTENSDHSNWQPYQEWQAQQQAFSTRLSHGLPYLFASDFLPVALARQMAMLGLDLCPPARRHFAKKASARGGILPSLLQTP